MRRFTALAATLFTLPLAVHAATQTFTYTGAEQDFVVPAGVMAITVTASGAQGGAAGNSVAATGLGGSISATIPVTSGESLAIFVGGAGGAGRAPGGLPAPGGALGFNGGASGGATVGGGGSGGGGGGASDVRQGGNGLANRVIVAGGGGGNSGQVISGAGGGGSGGGLTGANGSQGVGGGAGGGTGGSQSLGGTGGVQQGGDGDGIGGGTGMGGGGGSANASGDGGGGAGGGYNGGGGGGAARTAGAGGGGGGSSFAIGTATNVSMIQGSQSGNGQVVLTYPGEVTVSNDAELRNAILDAVAGDTITFTADITLAADLPAVQKSITIDGAGHALDGASTYRGFFVAAWARGTATFIPVSVAVQNLTIQNARAKGGNGGGGAGGGAGLGGGMFVAALASVTVSNVAFLNDGATGGYGTPYSIGSGGGGGMGGNGGFRTNAGGGGGGLGLGANGGDGGSVGQPGIATGAVGGGAGGSGGPAGGANGGGGGGGGSMGIPGGGGGVGGLASITNGDGGAGGFGGGGGGEYNQNGGAGGFGGGGGIGSFGQNGGAGGFGGGGGSISRSGTPAVGGFGAGNATSIGGGGAGMGGAIFVMQGGSLDFAGPLTINGNTVAGGMGGNNGSAFGAGIFINGDNTLTVSPADGETETISNEIADQTGNGGTAGNAGAGGLSLTGAGTLVLGGTNTYTGPTNLTAGRLRLNGSLDARSAVTIGTASALSGSGTAAGAVALSGLLSADDGQLTLGSLTWSPAGQLSETIGGSSSTPPVITGALTKSATGTYLIGLTDGGVLPNQTYTLMTFGSNSGFAASDFTVRGIPGTLTLTGTALTFTAPAPPVYGVTVSVAKGKSRATFTITNIGTTTTAFQLGKSQQVTNSYPGPKPPKSGKSPFQITYTLDGMNITKALESGTAAIALPAGGSAQVILKVIPRQRVAFQRKIQAQLSATSQADPTKTASARVKLTIKSGK